VVLFAKSFTTKATKVHEGNISSQKPSCTFVSLVVQDFIGSIVKLRHTTPAVGVLFAKSFTTKATKVHEGNIWSQKPS